MTWSDEALKNVIATLESGSRPTGGASIDGGEVLSIGGENILQSGGVTLEDVKRVPVAFFNRMTKGHLRDDDVLINKDGAQTGKVGWYHPGRALVACINEHVFLLRGDPAQITQGYLYYSLLSDLGQAQIRLQISGSAQPGLKTGFTKGVNVDIPADLREQSMIVRVLSTVDRAIEETEALIAKQQRIKTGLMQDLLTRGVDEHRNLRSEKTHEFKDSPLGRIPVEWDIASLGSVAECVTSGSRGWAKYYRENGALFIRIGNLTREHINLRLDDLVFVQPPESAEGLRTAVQADDLLISVTADLGVIGVIPKGFVEGYVNQHIALARLRPADVLARFVAWFLSSREGKAQFDRLNESGAKAGLNLPTVRSLLFPRPDVDEQHRIAVAIDACVQTVDQHACGLRKLQALKRGLMQDLLTGDRRVTALLEQREGVAT